MSKLKDKLKSVSRIDLLFIIGFFVTWFVFEFAVNAAGVRDVFLGVMVVGFTMFLSIYVLTAISKQVKHTETTPQDSLKPKQGNAIMLASLLISTVVLISGDLIGSDFPGTDDILFAIILCMVFMTGLPICVFFLLRNNPYFFPARRSKTGYTIKSILPSIIFLFIVWSLVFIKAILK